MKEPAYGVNPTSYDVSEGLSVRNVTRLIAMRSRHIKSVRGCVMLPCICSELDNFESVMHPWNSRVTMSHCNENACVHVRISQFKSLTNRSSDDALFV